MTKKIAIGLVAVALCVGACGGGSASSGGSTRQGSHPDQGTAAPHIECGSSAGHHGGGCSDSSTGATSGGATASGTGATEGGAPPATTTTTTP